MDCGLGGRLKLDADLQSAVADGRRPCTRQPILVVAALEQQTNFGSGGEILLTTTYGIPCDVVTLPC